jgi:2-dehydro-3-deoxyphosphooctonate aldolase (KDO 8-P synthase)
LLILEIPTMQHYASTVLDVTHSAAPTAGVTGGRPDMIETIAKAGIAVGVDGIFIRNPFDPANAKNGANKTSRLFRRIDDQISSY